MSPLDYKKDSLHPPIVNISKHHKEFFFFFYNHIKVQLINEIEKNNCGSETTQKLDTKEHTNIRK